MNAIDFIRQIETKYGVRSIKVKGIEVWPFLRIAYFFAYRDKYLSNTVSLAQASLWTKIKRVKNIFYGFCSFFRKYDYILFIEAEEYIALEKGKGGYKRVEELINMLADKGILVIESPAYRGHSPKDKTSHRQVVSLDAFLFLSRLIPVGRIRIENEQVLDAINERYSEKINRKKIVKVFFQLMKIFDIFVRLYKPKLIFVSDYYAIMHSALIYVAHTYNIKVVEVQHGIINRTHPAYNISVDLGRSFFPDYLFSFGDYVKQVFDEKNYFIKKENVFSIGYWYIEYMNKEYLPSEETVKLFENYRSKYKKIVAVSSQLAVEKKLIEFIRKSAILDKTILYVFVPRDPAKDHPSIKFPKNVTILKELNIYQIIMEVDFHSTVYSTCALEAPALGVANILIDIDNFARDYYLDLLEDKDITKFVDTEKEFVSTILHWCPRTKKEIMGLHSKFYRQNCKESLKQALQIALK